MKRLFALGFSLALATSASLALADVPGPTTTTVGATTGSAATTGSGLSTSAATTGSGFTTSSGATGAGAASSTGSTSAAGTGETVTGVGGGPTVLDTENTGCAAAPGAARGSAALLVGLGMLCAIPLLRRRNGAKK